MRYYYKGIKNVGGYVGVVRGIVEFLIYMEKVGFRVENSLGRRE